MEQARELLAAQLEQRRYAQAKLTPAGTFLSWSEGEPQSSHHIRQLLVDTHRSTQSLIKTTTADLPGPINRALSQAIAARSTSLHHPITVIQKADSPSLTTATSVSFTPVSDFTLISTAPSKISLPATTIGVPVSYYRPSTLIHKASSDTSLETISNASDAVTETVSALSLVSPSAMLRTTSAPPGLSTSVSLEMATEESTAATVSQAEQISVIQSTSNVPREKSSVAQEILKLFQSSSSAQLKEQVTTGSQKKFGDDILVDFSEASKPTLASAQSLLSSVPRLPESEKSSFGVKTAASVVEKRQPILIKRADPPVPPSPPIVQSMLPIPAESAEILLVNPAPHDQPHDVSPSPPCLNDNLSELMDCDH